MKLLPWVRSRRSAGRRPPAEPYHAVSVLPGPVCCAAARNLAELRFLCSEAPGLPLAACDACCRCVYQHHGDRREPSLQSTHYAMLTGKAERRR